MTREEAIKELKTEYLGDTDSLRKAKDMAIEALSAEAVQGKWIDDGCIEKCNQCGERREFPHWKFCPNCGVRMKGGDDE